MAALTCQYCGRVARHRFSSAHLYQGRDYGPIWECPSCEAHCGCHPDGSPLGTLANNELRQVRIQVKAVFNPLWTDMDAAYPGIPVRPGFVRQLMRRRAYEWLAEQMKLPVAECHIAMFDAARCLWAIQIINDLKPSAVSIRAWAKAREPKTVRARKVAT